MFYEYCAGNVTTCNLTSGNVMLEPACQCRRHEMQIRSLGWDDPLDEGMVIHSSILVWRTPWTEELMDYSPQGLRVRHNLGDLARRHAVRVCVCVCVCVCGHPYLVI